MPAGMQGMKEAGMQRGAAGYVLSRSSTGIGLKRAGDMTAPGGLIIGTGLCPGREGDEQNCSFSSWAH